MNASEIRYPIGVQSFKKLREEGYTYVDKTQYIPLLLRNNYYFLSRPRRFGKSLLLSMLEAYFRGQKELFDGLAVYKWEKEWLEYPVIHVDFNRMKGTSIDGVMRSLKRRLKEIADSYAIDLPYADEGSAENDDIGDIFSQLVRQLWEKTGRKVVILIDEYDKGIIEVLEDEDKRLLATDTLRPFFSVLKSDDEYIKFTFITGVSRFRNTTIFSGANNLRDISMSEEFASLLGITQKELEDNFTPSIREMALKQEWTFDETLLRLRNQYDGYRFTSSRELVYNPFSLLNCFQDKALKDYWVQSGSSRILAIYLKGSDFALEELTDKWINVTRLGATYSRRDPVSLLFQTGYLTISEYDRELNEVKLRIPNQEVQGMMSEILIPEFVKGIGRSEIEDKLSVLRRAVVKGDVETMMKTLRSLLSAVPYHEADKVAEKHLHLCIQIVFLLLGVNARSEIAISGGRVDMVATTPKRVYVFEFKLDRSAGDALKQIDEKGYALQWTAAGRTVYKIGVEFSSRLRTIASWTYTVQP